MPRYRNTGKQTLCIIDSYMTKGDAEKKKVSKVLVGVKRQIIFMARSDRDVSQDDMSWLKNNETFKELVASKVLVDISPVENKEVKK